VKLVQLFKLLRLMRVVRLIAVSARPPGICSLRTCACRPPPAPALPPPPLPAAHGCWRGAGGLRPHPVSGQPSQPAHHVCVEHPAVDDHPAQPAGLPVVVDLPGGVGPHLGRRHRCAGGQDSSETTALLGAAAQRPAAPSSAAPPGATLPAACSPRACRAPLPRAAGKPSIDLYDSSDSTRWLVSAYFVATTSERHGWAG
jgi:hypothetical protein